MAEPTLYLFDGYNLLHAGSFSGVRELTDQLASFVGLRGARGILVFDGAGETERHGPLEVRYAPHADALLERLAADHRDGEHVCLVSSDFAVRGTSGQEVTTRSSRSFVRELMPVAHGEPQTSQLADHLDDETRAQLERLRRGEKD